jgi:hypothetical protein
MLLSKQAFNLRGVFSGRKIRNPGNLESRSPPSSRTIEARAAGSKATSRKAKAPRLTRLTEKLSRHGKSVQMTELRMALGCTGPLPPTVAASSAVGVYE